MKTRKKNEEGKITTPKFVALGFLKTEISYESKAEAADNRQIGDGTLKPFFIVIFKYMNFMYSLHHIDTYPLSTGLSWTHITASSQLARLLNWCSTAPASQWSGFMSRAEFFRLFSRYCLSNAHI